MKLVIIGGSFSGINAALEARKAYPNAEIVIVERQQTLGFVPGSTFLYLKGLIENLEEGNWIKAQDVTSKNIQIMLGVSCLGFLDTQTIELSDGHRLSFDKLIIATGSSQFSRLLGTKYSEKIRTFKTKKDAEKLLSILPKIKSVVVIGAGHVGLEMAEVLANQNKEVYLYESNSSPLFRYFDPELLTELIHAIENKGIHLYLNDSVRDIIENQELKIISDKRLITADLALLAVNTRPDNQMWANNLNLNSDGTIWVDEYMQTSCQNVFAIGDAVQVNFQVTKESMYLSLVNNAVRTAKIAVANLVNASHKDPGALRTIGNYFFGYYYGSTGLTESEQFFYQGELEAVYLEKALTIDPTEKIRGKLIFNKETEILVGAQLISTVNIFDKLSILALAIETNQTKESITRLDAVFHAELAKMPSFFSDFKGTSYEN